MVEMSVSTVLLSVALSGSTMVEMLVVMMVGYYYKY